MRAPVNRVLPRISGNPRLRQVLSCTRGDWDDETADPYAFTYKWFRGSTEIVGATASTYTTVKADAQQNIACRVRAEDLTDATSASVNIRRPDNLVAPAITGDTRLFRTLTCSRGDWDDVAADRYAVTYRGSATASLIPGETAATYTVKHDDMDKSLYCRVSAEALTDANSAAVYPDRPRAIVPPQMSGLPHLRGEMSCTRGTWDDTPEHRYSVSYQWYRNSTPINGATESTYVIGTSDLNRYLECRTTAEVLRDSSAPSVYVYGPRILEDPVVDGIAHPRRELTCTRGDVERLGRQPVRAQLPVAAQQPADPRRRRA